MWQVWGGSACHKANREWCLLQIISRILLDGKPANLPAYIIDGSNYFKLYDIGQVFGFNVGWKENANIITIDTK